MLDILVCILLLLAGAFVREIVSGGGFLIKGTKNYDARLKDIAAENHQRLKGYKPSKEDRREFAEKYYKGKQRY